MDNIQEELLKTIELLIEKKIGQLSSCRTVASVVQGVKGNQYLVSISGQNVWANNGTDITFSVGSPVWVHIPNEINSAFILGRR